MLTSLLRSRLVRALLGSAGLRIAGTGLTILMSITLARLLGPEGIGFYAFALSVVALAGLPVQLGVPVVVLRETAKAETDKTWPVMRGVWLWAFRRVGISAAVVLPAVALAGWALEGRVVPQGGVPVLWAALPLVPLIAVAQLRGSALRGLDRPVLGQLPDTVIRPAGFLVFVLVLSGTAMTPQLAALAHVGGAVVAFAVGTMLLWRATPAPLISASADLSQSAAWARAVLPLALISGIQLVMQNINIVLLGALRPPEEVGLFRISMSAANLTLFGLTVVNFVIAPRFAKLNATMERGQMARIAQRSAALSLGAALPVALVLVLGGPQILAWLYGDAFAAAYLAMAVLVGSQLINALFGSCGNLLNMTGHERDAARALVVALVFNLGLNVTLIPILGGTGAALATLASTVTWNLLMERAVKRKLGFTSSALGLLRRPNAG